MGTEKTKKLSVEEYAVETTCTLANMQIEYKGAQEVALEYLEKRITQALDIAYNGLSNGSACSLTYIMEMIFMYSYNAITRYNSYGNMQKVAKWLVVLGELYHVDDINRKAMLLPTEAGQILAKVKKNEDGTLDL